ncbi:MAG: DUF1549 domain-containing protein [Roseibacillus sp.]|nr:DUF1549 domain-containing protein [Roseibacillus sp.]
MIRETTIILCPTAFRLSILALLALALRAPGAEDSHWAFQSLRPPALPEVEHKGWVRTSLDHFILAASADESIATVPRADRRVLLRRAYFDLVGLPPTPAQVEAFLADQSPGAWAKVIDQLLASPHYGERWGRHWLDLARYGDSNGGDENHAYPLAWRYRNWVIGALNRDLPYDQFVREQLSGDLMAPVTANRIAATGFLAIGTKILAEKDPVKKRADIVDEQIDTMGRVFLGLSLGCARCHDHKFDPVPERDYYALAGIFHSTAIEDRELKTPDAIAAHKARGGKIEVLTREIAQHEKTLETFVDLEGTIEWEAEAHDRGNVIVDRERYGEGIGIISDPGSQKNYAEYDIEIRKDGTYQLALRYAAAASRPGQVLVDGTVVIREAISQVTGGWMPPNQRWHHEGLLNLKAGKRVLRIESEPLMSHLDKVRLLPIREPARAAAVREKIEALQADRTRLEEEGKETFPKVMAVKDGTIADARINLRGNPHDLGDPVPRGFLSSVGAPTRPGQLTTQSGRLELAEWMTTPRHPLTARVIVNRVWHWHFGNGLVTTPDNFGTTGSAPANPTLLDHLTHRFIEDGWSLKKLHRHIMLSNTYQLASSEGGNRVRRMEAEVFRDAVLSVSGSLKREAPAGPPPTVKAQDPSPADIARNREVYEDYPHRTVYLPVVRSHVYDFLSLLDFPNPTTPVGRRNSSTVATQALLMLNSPFLLEKSAEIATGIRSHDDPLEELYLRLFARPATQDERREAAKFLEEAGGDEAWTLLCHTLLISNEFLYLR